MSSMQKTVALESVSTEFGRHALFAGVLVLMGGFWFGAMYSNDDPATVKPSVAATTTAGKVEVPAYYFPVEADGVDTYMGARETDCGGTMSAVPHDYPSGWLRP